MVFSKYLVPSGGWKFIEGDITIHEETLDKLVLALVAHRINNGKPVGSPAQEIERQILERQKNVNISGKS